MLKILGRPFLVFYVVLYTVTGDFLPIKSQLGQVLGESCTSDPSYQMHNFYLMYWPPSINSTFLIVIDGYYTRECNVNSIQIGTSFNDQEIQFEKITDIGQDYTSGDEYGANIMTVSGLVSGNYVKEFVIIGNDGIRNSNFLACWKF